MNALILIAIALIVGLVIIGWFVLGYNKFIRLKAMAQEAWSGVDVQLKRRYDLIPNLVATVKQYSIHEKAVLENVTRMRSLVGSAHSLEEKVGAEAQLSQALRSLMVVVEQYPQLKANENFLSLQQQLSKLEHEIQLARRYYNGTVRNYNIAVSTFPEMVVARATGFQQLPYFEIAQEQRENPGVHFND